MTWTGHKKHTTALLVIAVVLLATLLLPGTAYAQDPSPVDPISDGTGGSSTLALPGQVKADEAREALTPKAQTTVDPSTGFGLSSFAFQLLKARGDAQPGLSLSYNSSNANVVGFAGLGWTLPVSSITRRGAAGMPLFTDDVFTASPSALAAPGSTFDEYLADGEPLVPICAVGTCSSAQLLAGERLPASLAGTSLSGFMYFRRQSDDGARYFFSPGGQTWLKQERSGVVTQYGHPLDSGSVDPSLGDAIERPAPGTNFAAAVQASTAVYGWEIVRQTDAVGNTVYYAWTDNASLASGSTLPGTLYLSDVYDTLGVGQSPVPGAFAHHVHLTWALSVALSAPVETPIWRARPLAQLMTVDVTSASAQSNPRALVRRYTLSYTPNPVKTRNRLTSITLEGECATATGTVLSPIPEVNNLVPIPSGCPSPPLLTLAQYGYAPDPSAGQDYAIGTAWSLAAPVNDYFFPGFLDVTGDGAADFLFPNVGTGGPNFFVEPFSATSLSSLVDPTGGQLVGPFALQNTRDRATYPLVFGDWLADGALDWLVQLSAGQWAAYGPSGGTFVGSVVNAANCQTGACNAGRSFDVDGDGLPDSTLQPTANNPLDSVTYLTQRAHDGSIVPFGLATPAFFGWETDDMTNFASNNPYDKTQTNSSPIWRSIADVDGDGLADSVYGVNFEVLYTGFNNYVPQGSTTQLIWLNHGDGSFGSPNPSVSPSSVERNAEAITGFQLPLAVQSGGSTDFVRMVDLNLDGLADLIQLTSISLSVCLQTSQGLSQGNSCSTLPLPPNTPSGCGNPSDPGVDPTSTIFEVADIDGTGVPRILFSRYSPAGYSSGGTLLWAACADNVIYEVAVAPGSSPSLGAPPSSTLPGLLTSVTLLGGETQAITYQPIRTLPRVTPIPTSAWVVTNITSNNGLSSAKSPFSRTTSVTYSYSGPVYDARDQQFVGFQSVVESHAGDAGAPGLVRTTTYATTACGAATGTPCTGQVDYGWFRRLRGLPVLVEDTDSTDGNYIRATVKYYKEQNLYTGLDGRVVRKLPLSEEHRHNFTGTGGIRTTFVPLLAGGTNPYETYSARQSYPVILPQASKPTQQITWSVSALGDRETIVDFGQPGVDKPIRTELVSALPPGDQTGWSYRLHTKTMGYTANSWGITIASPPARAYTYTYTALGQLLTETASLPNEPPPMSAAGGFAAGTPPDATTSTSVCLTGCTSGGVTGIQYDAYGNATTVPRANGRCTSTLYDPLFALVPQSSFTYLRGCGSAAPPPISTLVSIDLGLEAPVQKTSAFTSAEGPAITKMRYDSFGRLVEVDKPSAASLGAVDPNPALLVQYSYIPILEIDSQTSDGTPPSQSVPHAKVIDGFGDTLLVGDYVVPAVQLCDGACTGVPDAGPWLYTGVMTRYTNGLPRYTHRPTYSSFWPPAFIQVPQGDTTPPALTTYDGAGRPLVVSDHNGNGTQMSYAFDQTAGATCTTVLDSEQAFYSHKGSSTETCTDGHGRTTFTQHVLANTAQGKQTVTTTTTYTAAGEPTAITQSTSSGSYSRQRTYDSLGRMVRQTEPNTGTWQYAYNDSGDLVGIMDARGCGEVLYHDGAGRLVAEDYSPCPPPSDAPAYSPPNLATGDGTEAFYLYDGHGNVASQYDRAQATTYTYDGRDRLVQTNRVIAVPGGSNTLATRYAPHVYSKSVLSYSEGDRPLVATTGADAPSLLVSGQSVVTTAYWSNGPVQILTSSYGAVLADQVPSSFGKVLYQQLGDPAGTQTSLSYDWDGALTGLLTTRSAGPWISYAQGTRPAATDFTTQAVLADMSISYDTVGNPVMMTQPTSQAPLSAWPAGAQPWVKRQLAYWDDYRLESSAVRYASVTGDDPAGVAGNPYTAAELAAASYPRPAAPSTGNRVRSQTFGYDFRGNVTSSTDDANDLWDRSLGTVSYTPGTDRLATSAQGGSASYDASGNVSTLTTATGQTYEFLFDEMGRLARAVRQDGAGTITSEDYTYDAKGERVTTHTTPALSAPATYTVYAFDSLVLKNASFPDANGDYQHDDTTEHVYFGAGAGLVAHVFNQPGLPAASSSNVHMHLQLTDGLGSTSYVLDQGTSEVVEAISYLPYGGIDSDWRSPRWQSPREDARFTGQWDNAEVGLVYMHARYYSPQLGRFISPDPKTIHGAKGHLNPYAYAHGSPFRFNDPTGLDPTGGCDAYGCAVYDPDQNVQDATTGQLNVGEVAISSPIDPLRLAPENGKLLPTYNESGNLFAYSPGADTTMRKVLTEKEQQEIQFNEFMFLASMGEGLIAPKPLIPIGKGPPATLGLADEVNALSGEYFYKQTISLQETNGGPTYIAAKGIELNDTQIAWAQERNYTVVTDNPGWHAEWQNLGASVDNGEQPTFGVATNLVCDGCSRRINGANGWVDAFTYGFPFSSFAEGP
jgi:RHS repeat-associated protein